MQVAGTLSLPEGEWKLTINRKWRQTNSHSATWEPVLLDQMYASI